MRLRVRLPREPRAGSPQSPQLRERGQDRVSGTGPRACPRPPRAARPPLCCGAVPPLRIARLALRKRRFLSNFSVICKVSSASKPENCNTRKLESFLLGKLATQVRGDRGCLGQVPEAVAPSVTHLGGRGLLLQPEPVHAILTAFRTLEEKNSIGVITEWTAGSHT